MTKYVLAEAISQISDRHILEAAFYSKNRLNRGLVKWIAACLTLIICITAIVSVLSKTDDFQHPIAEYYNIPSLDEISVGKNLSRSGVLTPINSNCKEESMTNKDLRRFFQCSDYDLFKDETSNYTMILNPDKTVHTIRMSWHFDDGYICAIFDPSTYPKFLFASNSNSKICVNNYELVIQKTLTYNSNTILDIGIKNENMGIWVFGSTECKEELELVINFILNSSISFDLK